jgi:hypothetical protein
MLNKPVKDLLSVTAAEELVRNKLYLPENDAADHPALRGVTLDGGHGVAGVNYGLKGTGVFGMNYGSNSLGFLGGKDKIYRQNVGVYGQSDQQGVFGHATTSVGTGVYGSSKNGGGFGVRGESTDGIGVQGTSFGNGIGVVGIGGRLAGQFQGNVEVTGDIRLVNADCAEDFDVPGLAKVEAGTVMVIDSQGSLRPCDIAYDKRCAGVISGAGTYQPAIVLDRQPEGSGNRQPVALVGKVFCNVDASYGAIAVGDLLTTSATPGHAMHATDRQQAFGAVIGKALRTLTSGQGQIPILVALQ